MHAIKHEQHVETCAAVFWGIFDACRSRDFAQKVLQYAEEDAELAQKLMAIIKHAYPGQYARIMKGILEESPVATSSLSNAGRHIITTTLGENPHSIIARLKFKNLLYTILPVPDSQRMITLDSRGEVGIWNTTTWKKDTAFELPKARYYSHLHAIALTPDGKRLFTTDNATQSIRVFEFEAWDSPIASLRHPEKIYSVGVTADRTYILGGGEKIVKVWEHETWREITELTGHQQGIEVVKTIPGKPFVVTGDRQGWLRVWGTNWKPVVDFHVKSLITNSVAFSPDGHYMVVVDTLATYLETNVRIWETDSWQQVAFFAIPSPTPITCFAFTPDGKYLLTGSDVIKFLETGTWQETLTLANADTRALAVLPDGQHIVAGKNVWKIDWSQLG
jgi:WD40 repeat protein